jgi:hypothetical protein
MGFYHCNSCLACFSTPLHIIPEKCPYCNNIHFIQEIQKGMYDEWMQLGKDSVTWSELEQLRHFNKMIDFAQIIWDGYERHHRGG